MPWQTEEQIKKIRAATDPATGELIPGMRAQGKAYSKAWMEVKVGLHLMKV